MCLLRCLIDRSSLTGTQEWTRGWDSVCNWQLWFVFNDPVNSERVHCVSPRISQEKVRILSLRVRKTLEVNGMSLAEKLHLKKKEINHVPITLNTVVFIGPTFKWRNSSWNLLLPVVRLKIWQLFVWNSIFRYGRKMWSWAVVLSVNDNNNEKGEGGIHLTHFRYSKMLFDKVGE